MLNKYTRVLLTGANIWYLGEGMLGPLFAILTERVGGDILDITLAYASYLFVMGVTTILIGRFSDKSKSQEKLMVLGYALNALFTFGYLLVDSPQSLFIVQVCLGFASALAMPTWEALYSKHENKQIGGYVWGLAEGQSNIITAFALIFGGFMIHYHSFTVLFFIMGCIQVLAAIYQSRILRIKH